MEQYEGLENKEVNGLHQLPRDRLDVFLQKLNSERQALYSYGDIQIAHRIPYL